MSNFFDFLPKVKIPVGQQVVVVVDKQQEVALCQRGGGIKSKTNAYIFFGIAVAKILLFHPLAGAVGAFVYMHHYLVLVAAMLADAAHEQLQVRQVIPGRNYNGEPV